MALVGCTDPHGRLDVGNTLALAAVGAGTAVVGGAIADDVRNRNTAYAYAAPPVVAPPASALPPIAGGAYYQAPVVGYPPRHGYGSPHYDHGYGTPWGGPRFYGPGGTWRCSPDARASC